MKNQVTSLCSHTKLKFTAVTVLGCTISLAMVTNMYALDLASLPALSSEQNGGMELGNSNVSISITSDVTVETNTQVDSETVLSEDTSSSQGVKRRLLKEKDAELSIDTPLMPIIGNVDEVPGVEIVANEGIVTADESSKIVNGEGISGVAAQQIVANQGMITADESSKIVNGEGISDVAAQQIVANQGMVTADESSKIVNGEGISDVAAQESTDESLGIVGLLAMIGLFLTSLLSMLGLFRNKDFTKPQGQELNTTTNETVTREEINVNVNVSADNTITQEDNIPKSPKGGKKTDSGRVSNKADKSEEKGGKADKSEREGGNKKADKLEGKGGNDPLILDTDKGGRGKGGNKKADKLEGKGGNDPLILDTDKGDRGKGGNNKGDRNVISNGGNAPRILDTDKGDRSNSRDWGKEPLILDIDKDGIVSATSGIGIDIDGDSIADGAAIGGDKMLSMGDFDGDGEITGKEVLGNFTFNPFTNKPVNAPNGFEALKQIAISAQDFTDIKDIIDANGLVDVAKLNLALESSGKASLGFVSGTNNTTLESIHDVSKISTIYTNQSNTVNVQHLQTGSYQDDIGQTFKADDVWFFNDNK